MQIPAGLLLVAPIWSEHQQAYIDHGCPWYMMGRATTYVPIGVHKWNWPRGLGGLVLDYLIGDRSDEESRCRNLGCLSREYWGISGLDRVGGKKIVPWFAEDTPEHDQSMLWCPPAWATEDCSLANPHGFCHRCLWVLPHKQMEAMPLCKRPEDWDVLWEHRGLRGANWRLILKYLKPRRCNAAGCNRVLGLPGARTGIGGEYHMMEMEAACDAAQKWSTGLMKEGRCVYCMTRYHPGLSWGLKQEESRVQEETLLYRHLYEKRSVPGEWAMSRFEGMLVNVVVDVRWVGDMFYEFNALWKRNIAGGRFDYLYYAGEGARWDNKRDRRRLLLGYGVGAGHVGLTARARDGMYERRDHGGMIERRMSPDGKGEARKGVFDGVERWKPPDMLPCADSPGGVRLRRRYEGLRMPHLSPADFFINHVGRVCDMRRRKCPYRFKQNVARLSGRKRREVLATRERLGVEGKNRGKEWKELPGGCIWRPDEAWGPPLMGEYGDYRDDGTLEPLWWELA